MQFSPNTSPKTLVFGDVKMFRKFEWITPATQFSADTLIL